MNPSSADDPLAPGPKTLPTTLIHTTNESKGNSFEPGQNRELIRCGLNGLDFGLWTLVLGLGTLIEVGVSAFTDFLVFGNGGIHLENHCRPGVAEKQRPKTKAQGLCLVIR